MNTTSFYIQNGYKWKVKNAQNFRKAIQVNEESGQLELWRYSGDLNQKWFWSQTGEELINRFNNQPLTLMGQYSKWKFVDIDCLTPNANQTCNKYIYSTEVDGKVLDVEKENANKDGAEISMSPFWNSDRNYYQRWQITEA